MSISLNRIGKNLAANSTTLRKKSDMSFAEMADATGVSRRTLQRIEAARKANRSYQPMLKTVARLAAATGASLDDFLGGRLTFQ